LEDVSVGHGVSLVWDDFCQALFFLDFLLLWSGPVCAWC
jgi:hypothetical protein